ncbi:MAG: hypothetical protein VZR64_10745 [Eubacterium sp.]|nr:hypothetical protein [Eubacterium sp.]
MKDAVGATSDKIELKLNESDDGYEVVLIPDKDWCSGLARMAGN